MHRRGCSAEAWARILALAVRAEVPPQKTQVPRSVLVVVAMTLPLGPQNVSKRPTSANGCQRHNRRSEPISRLVSTAANDARTVLGLRFEHRQHRRVEPLTTAVGA